MRLIPRLRVFALLVFPVVGCNEVTTPPDTTTNCALSKANGKATIELPIGETGFTLTKEGYGSYLVPMFIKSSFQERICLVTNERMVEAFGRVMSPYPMRGTGTMNLWLGPTETTSAGGGGFVEVTPGELFTVKLGGTAQRCTPGLGWPGDVENTVRFPVREDFVTYVTVICPPP